MTGCYVFLDLYKGEQVENSIRLGLGDAMLETPQESGVLRKDVVSLVPVAWRTEAGEDPQGYFTDTRFIRDRAERFNPINADRTKIRFRLRVKVGSFKRTSPHN